MARRDTSLLAPAAAQSDDVKALTTPDSSVSLGIGHWSKDRFQEGIYDGMRKDGAYWLFDADVVKRDAATGTWFSLNVRNLGLDTRELQAEWLRQGNIGVSLEYSRIPRDTPYVVNTGLGGFGTTTNVRTTIVPGRGTNYDIGTVRDNLGFKFYKNLMPGLDFNFRFINEEKEGTRHSKRGGAAEFAVEPFDSTTQIAEATLSYAAERWQVSGGYIGNWFKNRNNLLRALDAPTPTAAGSFIISLPLDNEAHQLFLNGGYSFTPTTRGTFKLAYTRATQNERIATKDDPLVTSLAGSPSNLNGRLDTTLVQLGVTSRPTALLSLAANLRYHHVNEKTPQARFVKATSTGYMCDSPTGAVNNTVCADNTPLSFKTTTGKLEGTYRLPQGYSVIAGLDVRSQDRTVPVGVGTIFANGVDDQRYVPFRAKLDENTYRLQLRRAMSETVNGSLAYLHSKRKGSSYTRTNEAESDQINPIHIADRKRDKWRASIDWTPAEPVSLQFNVEEARDRYGYSDDRPFGLRDGKANLYSADLSYAISEKWQLTAWLSHDKTKATQFGQRAATSGASAARKEAHLEDIGNSFGFGLRGQATGQLKVGADLQWTRSEAKYPESLSFTGAGTVAFPTAGGQTVIGPLPDIHNRMTRLKLFATYAVQKNADIRVDFIHEKWRTDDWSWTFANGSPFVYGSTTDGSMVITQPTQKSNFIGARYIYKFQ